LANDLAFLGGLTTDLGFDGIECGDALQCLGGDRRAGRFLHVEESAAKMRPAMCENDVAALALDREPVSALPPPPAPPRPRFASIIVLRPEIAVLNVLRPE
jgi:hypothetical protein